MFDAFFDAILFELIGDPLPILSFLLSIVGYALQLLAPILDLFEPVLVVVDERLLLADLVSETGDLLRFPV